jgi:hypothetical protein
MYQCFNVLIDFTVVFVGVNLEVAEIAALATEWYVKI